MIDEYKNQDLTIPQLVSYPRTGSHWVRLILEQYLNKYCLPTSFYNTKEYWGYHLHDRVVGRGDEGATKNFDKVIYLSRTPMDVIYSLIEYDSTLNHNNINDIQAIINEYKNHLTRWMYNNEDIKQIIFITYEELKNSPKETFKKIILFLEETWDEALLMDIYKNQTYKNSSQVINDSNVISKNHFNGKYTNEKEQFIVLHGEYINSQFKGLWK